MRFHFHPAADNEFDLAVEYYEGCQAGLGLEFAEEVYATIGRIIEYPEVWSPEAGSGLLFWCFSGILMPSYEDKTNTKLKDLTPKSILFELNAK
jgi:mRNA interferase RelE/StbE